MFKWENWKIHNLFSSNRKNLKKQFFNAYKISNHNINKLILLLWKGVYPYAVFSRLFNIWIIGKNSMKHRYLKQKILTVILTWKILLMHITRNRNSRRTLWVVCSTWYIIVSWCIWELSKYVSWNIQTRPYLFSYCTRISMAISL